MKPIRYLSFFLLLLTSQLSFADKGYLESVATDHILEGYEHLLKSTAALQQDATEYCGNQGKQDLSRLKTAYLQAMYDWQSIQHIRFGPVDFLLRHYRFQTWPDKRGAVSRHLGQLIETGDESILDADKFAQGSTAVQGFSALETLLYRDRDLSGYSCTLLVAISKNLHRMSKGIIHEWREPPARYMQQFLTAADGNEYFESAEEIDSLLMKNLYTELQLVVDQKLGRPLGSNIHKARGRRAESWKSEQSLEHIRLNLLATRALFEKAFAPRLQNAQLKQQILDGFQSSLAAIDNIDLPLHEAVSNPDERLKVEQLRKEVSQLKALISIDLTQEMGIPLGFNSLDGD